MTSAGPDTATGLSPGMRDSAGLRAVDLQLCQLGMRPDRRTAGLSLRPASSRTATHWRCRWAVDLSIPQQDWGNNAAGLHSAGLHSADLRQWKQQDCKDSWSVTQRSWTVTTQQQVCHDTHTSHGLPSIIPSRIPRLQSDSNTKPIQRYPDRLRRPKTTNTQTVQKQTNPPQCNTTLHLTPPPNADQTVPPSKPDPTHELTEHVSVSIAHASFLPPIQHSDLVPVRLRLASSATFPRTRLCKIPLRTQHVPFPEAPWCLDA